MSDRAWEDLVDRIDVNFGITHSRKFEEAIEGERELKNTIDRIDFTRGGQPYRIERISSPAVVDKKTTYNKTGIATSSHVLYDANELTHKVLFYRMDDETPVEISPEDLLH